MKTVEYTIKDALGIHARPAGLLVKEAGKFASKIMIASPKKEVDAKRIMGVMSMGVDLLLRRSDHDFGGELGRLLDEHAGRTGVDAELIGNRVFECFHGEISPFYFFSSVSRSSPA